MKKFKKHIVTLAVALALVGSFVLGANASSTLTAIQAYLNYGITIEYNGEPQQMFDANGVRLYPITYNGSTYVPVRAVANIFGEHVDWDGVTKTVVLGTPTDGVDLINTIEPYSVKAPDYYTYKTVKSSDNKTTSIAGIELNRWIEMSRPYYAHVNDNCSGYYNIGGKYGILTFQAYSNANVTLEVRGNNDEVLASIPLTANQVPQTYTVPLAGATQLCISTKLPYSSAVYIFDTVLK